MQTYLVNGSSSLLFVISTIKAFYSSNLMIWKMSNMFLIVASFLCNANDYDLVFLFLDYLAIYLACISYLNNMFINSLYSVLLIYEYTKYNSIDSIKNLAFATALGKCVINTYLYVDSIHLCVVCTSSTCGFIVYKLRNHLLETNNTKYKVLLTYLFHFCVMNIMYVSSITAM
jgi:hypothetical protein